VKVLALELSSAVGSVAFCDETGRRDLRAFPADRKDSGFFYENLSAIYQQFAAPNLIVVGLGPGSYAGIRIAIATALGLKSAAGARLLGLPSICAVDRTEYLFVGDARRNSFFFAYVKEGRCLEGPTLARADEIASRRKERPQLPVIATQPLAPFAGVLVESPSALRLAELAMAQAEGAEVPLEPIYLREPYVTTPRK
jgi:tRNA threonylcarbamoyl adenosine modification protein YeaZ